MATEQSPPQIRIILTVAFSSVVILGALNSVFRSYFLMMTEEVEHEHLRTIALNMAHGRVQVTSFGDHLHVFFAVEQQPQAAAHLCMAVGENHADRQGARHRRRGLCGARRRMQTWEHAPHAIRAGRAIHW